VDGGPHTGSAVHTGIAVFPDPGEQTSWRRRGDGSATAPQSRLQVRARRDTGKTSQYIILYNRSARALTCVYPTVYINVLNSNERLRPPQNEFDFNGDYCE